MIKFIFQLNSFYLGLQESNSKTHNCDIQAAKIRKSELLAIKQNVTSSLVSNKRVKATLQEQLQSLWWYGIAGPFAC